MNFNYKLYNELDALRQQIKDNAKIVNGRAPVVCNDEALHQIVELCPKKPTDFEGISGIGKTFIDNYANDFLKIIRKYEVVETEKTVLMNSTTNGLLKELEKKLVSINKRNRLLYMPKATNKYAVDLFDTSNNPLDIIFKNPSCMTVCNTATDIYNGTAENISKYRKFVQLLREVNKDLRDKGQNDLYIGYPFVIGRMQGENFDVRAPLALFPVAAERTSTTITLSIDESRDVLYNNTLILAHYKFNGINKPLPNDTIEDYSAASFFQSLISFYKDNDICIELQDTELKKFAEYKADTFPQFRPGELVIEPCAVLGKFPVCDNSIQKDFDNIIQNNSINTLLNDLLVDAGETEQNGSYSGEQNIKPNDKPLTISEHDLLYINELNSSQESVISAIDSLDELVVQGPPGTGKSQVITSLISSFVNQNKTVLMVSEKKTALDVVYSRLGNLSQYALLIDDVGNKDLFYKQLQHMVSLGKFAEAGKISLDNLSSEIDALVKRLEVIAQRLYTPNSFGIEPYKLYQKNKKIDLSVPAEREKMMVINSKMDMSLTSLRYEMIDKIYHVFTDVNLTSKLDKYIKLTSSYQWLFHMKSNLTEYDIAVLSQKLTELKNEIAIWHSKNFIIKIFTKGQLNKKATAILAEFFLNTKKRLLKILLQRIDDVIESTCHYTEYQETKTLFDRLTKEERIYLSSMLNIRDACNCSLQESNDALYNQILYYHIGQFEAQNREVFQDIDGFDTIIRTMSNLMSQKQKLTKQKLELILSGEMYNISISKRYGEILRIIENKRKWSVNKFIKKFDFELFKAVKIWLLTPEVVSEIIPLQTGIFDLVIFDEASQMFVEKGIPSILRAKKVVIAGDHKQLRPSNLGAGRIEYDEDSLGEDEEIAAALDEESLLDLARFKYKDILLNFHYRSKYEELIAFSNYAFYNGRLYVSPKTEQLACPPIEVRKIENGMWINRSNIEEARYIVKLLKTFFEERKNDETIGIITFNISQRDIIDDLIDEECAQDPEFASKIRAELIRKRDGEDIGLFVKNIESVQGDERDVIIFSIGYAKNENGKVVRNFGWLNQQGGENRLNVAISRAKQKIYIVTSINPSELQVEDTKNEGPRILKKYLEYAFAVSERDEETAKQILLSFGDESTPGQTVSFDSDFENQIYDALVEKGYQVDTQVGIGGYSIDLAIKKNGGYVLGIECDGRLYHSSKSSRERDYHRQKYLESRGWRIYRVWSTNWWKNPKQEIAKICTVVDSL